MRTAGELNHWSNERIVRIDTERTYPLRQEWKPSGFWFDVDRDWYRWCKGEDFHAGGLSYRHRIQLSEDARILRITDPMALLRFTEEFAVPHPILGAMKFSVLGPFHDHVIDWPRVAENYQGIIIAPYCWQVRMELMWYYGWDCASGCVWDASVLSIAMVYFKGRRMN